MQFGELTFHSIQKLKDALDQTLCNIMSRKTTVNSALQHAQTDESYTFNENSTEVPKVFADQEKRLKLLRNKKNGLTESKQYRDRV